MARIKPWCVLRRNASTWCPATVQPLRGSAQYQYAVVLVFALEPELDLSATTHPRNDLHAHHAPLPARCRKQASFPHSSVLMSGATAIVSLQRQPRPRPAPNPSSSRRTCAPRSSTKNARGTSRPDGAMDRPARTGGAGSPHRRVQRADQSRRTRRTPRRLARFPCRPHRRQSRGQLMAQAAVQVDRARPGTHTSIQYRGCHISCGTSRL
ncbi:uncharacterized protein B0H18DRAFT_172026 [Fomitopsis serialis]|uniref:uncharacterized protein n=1 Tax=Fomitopsis serialis TaxID=139415 RepID=UPI002008544E|nr:uncharacterized protein B0H18DRAFT_172026 [Neoantrodia serialis]KAH9929710.1 hypothetical protein B0H18DRAFT_172026 [Neoantrodia serialis]